MDATSRTIPAALAPLLGYLQSLTDGRADLAVLQRLLHESRLTVADVAEFLHFEDRCYCRNLLAESPWFNVLVLCWKSGQRSPIHDHAQSVCAFKVLTGVCSEVAYDLLPDGGVRPARQRDYQAGEIVTSHDSETHEVSNLQEDGAELVTLHVYSPPLKTMRLYSPHSRASTEWRAPEF